MKSSTRKSSRSFDAGVAAHSINQPAMNMLMVALVLILSSLTSLAVTTNFTTSGTWTCPADVTEVTVECWGGGGAGGSATNAGTGTGGTSTVGGGGAGGAYAIKTNFSVTPANNYTVTVGAGGIPVALPPTEGAQGDGGDSWFDTSSTVLARGGSGGFSKNAVRPAQGNGGSCPAGSIGDTIYLGGNGANGNGAGQAAGGGGGSGGTNSVGNAGGSPNVQSGGAAVAGGGAGGSGRSGSTSGPGVAGGSPGGGGGGAAASANNNSQLGGAGAAGKVAITFTIPAPTYTWAATSGSADWTAAASWSPSRTTPAINDVLLFNQGGNSTATNVATQTIGKLQVSNTTTVALTPGTLVNALTIGEAAADALTVASGSQLNISGATGSTNLNIHVTTGAKGSISGSMSFLDNFASPNSFTLTATDASGITFNSGATFTQDCAGNVFGSGTANSVVFASGSTLVQKFGNNPFQKTQPASVVVFQPGSLFRIQGNLQPSASGRTYADVEINHATFSQTMSGAAPLTVSNLSVIQGALSVSMAGGFNLNGNVSVASGATLNLNNSVTTTSGKTVAINGTLGGTATISGDAAFTISSTGTLAPGTSGTPLGTMTFATAPALNGTNLMEIDRNGGSPLSDNVVLSSGTLNYGGALVVANVGAALQAGDSFTLFTAPVHNGGFATIVGSAGSGLAYSFAGGILSAVSDAAYLTNSVSGGVLTMSWSADHLGWILQSQTNSRSVGLTIPTNTWFDVPGSESMTSTNFTINPAEETVFFRLRNFIP